MISHPTKPTMVKTASSNVAEIGHAIDGMHVNFKGGVSYLYEGVPAELFRQALAADSIGKFIAQHIKGKYPFRRKVAA